MEISLPHLGGGVVGEFGVVGFAIEFVDFQGGCSLREAQGEEAQSQEDDAEDQADGSAGGDGRPVGTDGERTGQAGVIDKRVD